MKTNTDNRANYPELEDRICEMVRESWRGIQDQPAWVTDKNIDILNAITREDVRFLTTVDLWYSVQKLLKDYGDKV